jgi:hypothetical protein
MLGNSIRGLKQASWRLAYSSICIPVLTYGCQLWFRGKQVTLVRKLQVIQNEEIRIISGIFCTAPQDPLHHLLNILPMTYASPCWSTTWHSGCTRYQEKANYLYARAEHGTPTP